MPAHVELKSAAFEILHLSEVDPVVGLNRISEEKESQLEPVVQSVGLQQHEPAVAVLCLFLEDFGKVLLRSCHFHFGPGRVWSEKFGVNIQPDR